MEEQEKVLLRAYLGAPWEKVPLSEVQQRVALLGSWEAAF